MSEDVPLFEEPTEQPVTLSKHFATWEHRIAPDSKVKYVRHTMKRFHPCEECAYLQHESNGHFGPKRAVKMRRTGPGECNRSAREPCGGKGKKHESHIDLCNEHARLWKDQDAEDMKRYA